MAIDALVSDGTTDVNIGLANEIPDRPIEKSTKSSASGALKQQTAGSRLLFNVKARVPGAIYETLVALLTNGAEFYFYTATDTHTMFPNVVFPLAVEFSNVTRTFDTRDIYYISFTVKSIDYIEC